MIPGGTYGHMHHVLDGLTPHAAAQAVEHEFPAWHLHETPGGVWADTDPAPMPGPPVTLRAPDAFCMWQVLAEYEYRRYLAALPLHGHPGVTP